MMSLWVGREKARFASSRWFVLVAKRLLQFPSLLALTLRRHNYRRLGVAVGGMTIVQGLRIDGPAKHLSIGCQTFIARGVEVACHANVQIGSLVCINRGVRLLTASHDVEDPRWASFSRPIVIRDHAWIATGAIILPGVTIGTGAVVGAGSVVSRDVPDYAVVAGNPARKLDAVRPVDLTYDPVAFAAPYEAWLGRPKGNQALGQRYE